MEVEVCQMCGARGYTALLIYCDVCRVSAEHVYCLDRVSKVTQKVVEWSCEQCVPTYFCNQPILQPSSVVEERTVKQLPDNPSAGDASQKILSDSSLGSNGSAYGLPITDHVKRVESISQKSQLNLQTSMADTEDVPSTGKAASEKLGKTLVEQEAARQDVSESNIQYKVNLEYLESKMNWLKNRLYGLEEIERGFLEKKSEMRALIANRVATVDAKEQAMLGRVQEQKDIAVDAIMEARNNPGKHTGAAITETGKKLGKHTGGVISVLPHLKLKQFCKNRDAKGFLNYVMGNKNYIDAICDAIPEALKNATEPALFVLDSLKGFYPCCSQTTSYPKENTRDERTCVRRSCLTLIDSVPLVLRVDDFLDHKTKRQAKAIADDWKSRLDSRDAAIKYSPMEEEAFLKLLATFKITSEFDEEEVYKIVLAISHLRQTPNLCRSLCLMHRIPGIVEVLISQRRLIDAVHFVHAFKLTEKFPPAPLLRTYLKEVREDLQKKRKSSGGGDKHKSDAHLKELAALKTVVNRVEEYKLEAQYPIDSLRKRVIQLEKWKSNKKRIVDDSVTNQQRKMARVDNGRIDVSYVPAYLGYPPLVYNMNSSLHGSYRMEPPYSYHSHCNPYY